MNMNINFDQPVIIKFSATWCAPCKTLEPKLKKAVGDKVKLIDMDIEQYPDEAQKFNVRSVPTTIAFVNGEQFDAFSGDKPESWIIDFVSKMINNIRNQ